MQSSKSGTVDQLFEDVEEFWLGNFAVSIFIDGIDELVDFLLSHLSISTETFKSIVDEVEDFIVFQSSTSVSIVFWENGIDSLSELIVTGFATHFVCHKLNDNRNEYIFKFILDWYYWEVAIETKKNLFLTGFYSEVSSNILTFKEEHKEQDWD